jgi:hypothetical protein
VNLSLSEYSQKGLYLIFPDSNRLAITEEIVEQFAAQFLEDETKVPACAKKAVEFQSCSICPMKHCGEFCHALLPWLPIVDIVDQYVSYERVRAVFKGDTAETWYVSDRPVQEAIQYVCHLSLMHYCDVGKKYRKYFWGIMPLMEPEEIAQTTRCQVERLRLICKNDAFMNAFTHAHAVIELLSLEQCVPQSLEGAFSDCVGSHV